MTWVVCRVVTPKDMERYPNPLPETMNTGVHGVHGGSWIHGGSKGHLSTYRRTEKVPDVLHLKH